MPISLNGTIIESGFFSAEDELQTAISKNPQILFAEDEPRAFLVKREVTLPSAGRLDILLVDENGVPIAVEVKLGKNIQSRREVVAQVVDYASDLNALTVDELDDLVGQNLREVLVTQDAGTNNWKMCGANLRSGTIKIVIAVDESNADLTRIVQYLNLHSDIDVRLVEIESYQNGTILVPKILVGGEVEKTDDTNLPKMDPARVAFLNQTAETFNRLDFPFKATGSAKSYKQIKSAEWRGAIHYEIMLYKQAIGVEFHIENASFAALTEVIKKFDGQRVEGLPIEFEPNWSKGLGRIRLFIDIAQNKDPAKITPFITAFINHTRPCISQAVAQINAKADNG